MSKCICWDMVILVNLEESMLFSDECVIKNFVKVVEKVGFCVDVVSCLL